MSGTTGSKSRPPLRLRGHRTQTWHSESHRCIAAVPLTGFVEVTIVVGMRDLKNMEVLSPCSLSACSAQSPPVEEEVFENERFLPLRGWSSRNLLPTDRHRFSGGRNQPAAESTTGFPKIHLPDGGLELTLLCRAFCASTQGAKRAEHSAVGWEWEGPWELETKGYVDKEGWTYGVDFSTIKYPPPPGNQRKALQHFVRRRRYFRTRREVPHTQPAAHNMRQPSSDRKAGVNVSEADRTILGVVEPGDSLPLPYGWRSSGEGPVAPKPAGLSSQQWLQPSSHGCRKTSTSTASAPRPGSPDAFLERVHERGRADDEAGQPGGGELALGRLCTLQNNSRARRAYATGSLLGYSKPFFSLLFRIPGKILKLVCLCVAAEVMYCGWLDLKLGRK